MQFVEVTWHGRQYFGAQSKKISWIWGGMILQYFCLYKINVFPIPFFGFLFILHTTTIFFLSESNYSADKMIVRQSMFKNEHQKIHIFHAKIFFLCTYYVVRLSFTRFCCWWWCYLLVSRATTLCYGVHTSK